MATVPVVEMRWLGEGTFLIVAEGRSPLKANN